MSTTESSAKLLRDIALIACGRRAGKTIACPSCARKAPALLTIASTGALDALTAAICGHGGTCQDCGAKAETIINHAAGVPCDA
ncbi:hypothetical protein QR97_01940 [Streptomyces sp. PBH53]|uniref:hypothetical protein n=1 Tax=Streptomyces sp. PBH53 TaxID=1577075 RepID=UPI000655B968|nr:hypothetical protein [Streptomyces sp. PBH53]AKN68729.1 hypothetical protein QR97_01940 [Streptomyces sp. PBH53]